MRLGWLFKPRNLILIPVALSFAVWTVPGASATLRGFAHRADVTPPGVIFIALWYTLCLAVVFVGSWAGRRIRTFEKLTEFETSTRLEVSFYWFVSAAAVIGVFATIWTIAQSVSIWGELSTNNANLLAAALPGHASFATLRYATAVAAPVGVYLWQGKKATLPLAVINVLLLVINVTIDSRLSLIMAIFLYVFLTVRFNPRFKLKLWATVAGLVAIVGGLTVFNFLRNSNYYERFGVFNPFAMNFFQVAAYLDSPAQVSIGVANAITSGRLLIPGDPLASLGAIMPSFLIFDKSNVVPQSVAGRYQNVVSIADNFNANSAFADTYSTFGAWGLLYIVLVFAAAAFAFGVLVRYRSIVGVIPAVLLYGFAEVWRLFLFNQGILLFLILLSALGIAFSFTLRRLVDARMSALAPTESFPTASDHESGQSSQLSEHTD